MTVDVEVWERGRDIGSNLINTLHYHTLKEAQEFVHKFNTENGKNHTVEFYIIAKIGQIWR